MYRKLCSHSSLRGGGGGGGECRADNAAIANSLAMKHKLTTKRFYKYCPLQTVYCSWLSKGVKSPVQLHFFTSCRATYLSHAYVCDGCAVCIGWTCTAREGRRRKSRNGACLGTISHGDNLWRQINSRCYI